MDRITVKLEENNVLMHWPCPLCGGETGKEEVHPAIVEGQISNNLDSDFICDECLAAGPTGVRGRIIAQAANLSIRAEALEREASRLRELSHVTFEMPSVDALVEARRAAAEIDRTHGEAHAAYVLAHPRDGRGQTPWDEHVAYMEREYGTRSPACLHCSEPVWLALQGFFSGGSWTTNPDNEGPNFGCKELDVQAEQCAKSLSGRHEVQTE